MTEKSDFSATRGLLTQRVEAQERQISELKQQLCEASDLTNRMSSASRQLTFERDSNAIQFKALV